MALLEQLRHHLAAQSCERLLDRWLECFSQHSWPSWRSMAQDHALEVRCEAFLQALQQSATHARTFDVGAVAWREPVQQLSFTAGWLAGLGLETSCVLVLMRSLREVLHGDVAEVIDAMTMAAVEAHVAGVRERERQIHRRLVFQSQVVCVLGADVCGLFLFADPAVDALQDAVSRLLTLALMHEATHLVIVGTGLVERSETTAELLRVLATEQESVAKRQLWLVELPGIAQLAWAKTLKISVEADVNAALAAIHAGAAADIST